MTAARETTFGMLDPDEIVVVWQIYDLALLQIADRSLTFEDAPSSDIRTRMSLAILDAFRAGVRDVQVLKLAGISAIRPGASARTGGTSTSATKYLCAPRDTRRTFVRPSAFGSV